MSDDATRRRAAKPNIDGWMRALYAEARSRVDVNSADWKDGYETGFAEGASGDFNPDGSYKTPGCTDVQPRSRVCPCCDAGGCPDCAAGDHSHATPDRAATTGPYLDEQPKMFAIDDRGFVWAVWADGHWSMPVGTNGNYPTYAKHEYRQIVR